MEVSPGTFEGERDRFWVGIRSKSQNALVAASGYHSPASFHKDDNRLQACARARPKNRPARRISTMSAGQARRVHSKLLNMRDFQA
jgi:hypothetical protein